MLSKKIQDLIETDEKSQTALDKEKLELIGMSSALEQTQERYINTISLLEKVFPSLQEINANILNSYDVDALPAKIMQKILDYASSYYHEITQENQKISEDQF